MADRELGNDLRPKEGVSDLVQRTFLEARVALPRFHGRTEGEWQAWLCRILRNNLASLVERYRRTDKRKVDLEVSLDNSAIGHLKEGLTAEIPSSSDAVIHRERVAALHRVLNRLPEHYRCVIERRYQQGCSFEEIGQRLGRRRAQNLDTSHSTASRRDGTVGSRMRKRPGLRTGGSPECLASH